MNPSCPFSLSMSPSALKHSQGCNLAVLVIICIFYVQFKMITLFVCRLEQFNDVLFQENFSSCDVNTPWFSLEALNAIRSSRCISIDKVSRTLAHAQPSLFAHLNFETVIYRIRFSYPMEVLQDHSFYMEK